MSVQSEAMSKLGESLVNWFLNSSDADPRMKRFVKALFTVKTETLKYKQGKFEDLISDLPGYLKAERVDGRDSEGRRIVLISL